MSSICSKQVLVACFVFFSIFQQCNPDGKSNGRSGNPEEPVAETESDERTPPAGRGETGENQNAMIYLEVHHTVLGILPGVGGRAVFLSVGNSPNLLKSDPALWNEPDSLRPPVQADAPWKAYNGHTTWVGPQSEWWVHQELDTVKRNARALWPPDPWLIYSEYEIIEKTDSSVTLRSPESPVSGVQFTKYYGITGKGSIQLEVTCTNIREEPVSWDIWMNTRVDGYSGVYVPAGGRTDIRIKASETATSDTVPYLLESGFFRYLPEPPTEGKRGRSSKAFILPSKPWMAGFIEGYCLIIGFEMYDPGRIHPEQAMVEIFNATTNERRDALTEMEYHGPYLTLQPGESAAVIETWRVMEYCGTPGGHIEFLQGIE